MSDEIIKVLDSLAEKFGIAIDWTSQNILPYLQELCDKYINYEIWTSVLYVVICLIVACLMMYAIKKTFDSDGIFIIHGVIMFIALFIMVTQIIDIITALTFPEKLIYEYINYIASTH